MTNKSFSAWPYYDEEETNAVQKVLNSGDVNYWTGRNGRQFEQEFAAWSGSTYAVALMNGSVALDVALRALGVGPGDEVIVTPRSFIASVSCVVNLGATPIFVDVDLYSGNISKKTILPAITKKTKAIICVHLAGWPCDLDPIINLANHHGIFVIEDCSQAHGARYKGRSIGSIGHTGVWSFCQDKIMTTGGEGGMVTCNDKKIWSKIWSFKDHGKSYDAVYQKKHPPGFRWLHESFGTNYRMTEIQAVIGLSQLKKMPKWTLMRTSNAHLIQESLEQFSGNNGIVRVCQLKGEGNVHAYYKFYTYVRDENLAKGWHRDRIINEINNRGIPCFSGSCPEIYLENAFNNTNLRPKERLPIAKKLGETSLVFLVHPTISKEDIESACSVIKNVFCKATR